MAPGQHVKRSVEQRRPTDVEGAPAEEDLSTTDVAERADLDPDEQLNRPEQPDASPEEREQFEHPAKEPVFRADRDDA